MKKSISFAIFVLMMATTALFCSCGGDDDLLPDTENGQKPTITQWVEPFHVKDASIGDVKSYMTSTMQNYYVSDETSSATSSQLAYSSDTKNVGILYSFTKPDEALYSVISTELNVNKEVILKFLYAHYSILPGAGNSSDNIQYIFTNSDKSMVISTVKVSDTCFNVSYTFVAQ